MPLEQIPQQEIRQILMRAQEIAERSAPPVAAEDEAEPFLRAAEEVGIPREAMRQALQERRQAIATMFAVGDIVFAPLEDRHLYAASLTGITENSATVRFVNGGERTCAWADLRPVTALLGQTVKYMYADTGWYPAKVERYDPLTRSVWLSSSLEPQLRETLLSQIKVPPPKDALAAKVRSLLWKVGLAGAAGGTALGLWLSHLFH